MEFNRVIMNPPYDGSLHLRCLQSARNHIEKEKGQIVCLSPIRWLEDTFLDYKDSHEYYDFKDTILKGLCNIEIINAKKADKLFPGASFYIDLGIYEVKWSKGNFDYDSIRFKNCPKSIVKKIVKHDNFQNHQEDIGKSPCVKTPSIHGHAGKKDWKEVISPIKEISRDPSSNNTGVKWVNFKTEEEAENCRKYLESDFIKWWVYTTRTGINVSWRFIPYLDFTKEWTTEELQDYFNLTPEEKECMTKWTCFCK